ncbi:MAG: hypothetical protein QOG43_2198 [Actinomycetota bacterium]|nr:hypothetical protein [Actinomycetota bacterium]
MRSPARYDAFPTISSGPDSFPSSSHVARPRRFSSATLALRQAYMAGAAPCLTSAAHPATTASSAVSRSGDTEMRPERAYQTTAASTSPERRRARVLRSTGSVWRTFSFST